MITLLDGLSLGSIYALIALGYTMVYGIAKMLNFAHGDIIMVGAYAVYVSMLATKMPLVAMISSIVICTLLGIVVEKAAYKPLRGASPLAVLITAIGVSLLLQSVAQLTFGSEAKPIPGWSLKNVQLLKDLGLSAAAVTFIASVIIMVGLTVFINATRTGRAMLAVSEDRGAAILMGINVNRIITITFAIGSALAAIAGVLLCSAYPTLVPTTGSMPGIKAFTAAVFGGIGSIPGALLGGILLGVIEIFAKAYISTQLSDAIVFAVLIVVLLVRPTGLLGKQIREKV